MRNIVRKIRIDAAAGQYQEVSATGSYLRCKDSTATAEVPVILDGSRLIDMQPGTVFRAKQGDEFQKIAVDNTASATALTIWFQVADADEIREEALLVLNEIRTNVTANKIETPAAITLNVGNSYTASITDASAAIRTVLAQNTGTNEFWWGDSNVNPATNRGTRVLPNEVAIIDVSLANSIYFKSTADATISLNYLKVV